MTDKLNARDLMVITDALSSVVSCQGIGHYANTAYRTAWEKVFLILEGMEVPTSIISSPAPTGEDKSDANKSRA